MDLKNHLGFLGVAAAAIGTVAGLSLLSKKSESLVEVDDQRLLMLKALVDQSDDLVTRYQYGVQMNKQLLERLYRDIDFEMRTSPPATPEESEKRLVKNRAKMSAINMSLQDQEDMNTLAERYAVYVRNEYDKALNGAPIGDPFTLFSFLEKENKVLGGSFGKWPKKRA